MARNETGRTIRVRPDTYARFRDALQRLEEAAGVKQAKQTWEGELTADQFLNLLLDQREGHAWRRARAKAARKARKAKADQEASYVPVLPWWEGATFKSLTPAARQQEKTVAITG